MSGISEQLRSNGVLVVCPFDRQSPEYWTTPNDKPCAMCGGEPEGPDKCTGADLRIMHQAADVIDAMAEALMLILPLAKGYAAANRHDINAVCVAAAESALAKARGQ